MSDNKDSRKAAQRKWYQKNRISILAKRAQYYQKNKVRLQEYGRQYDKERRSKKQKDATKNSMKAAEVKNRLLQELDDY